MPGAVAVKAFHVCWDRFHRLTILGLPPAVLNGACLPLLAPLKPKAASGRGETGRRKGLKIPRLRSCGLDSRRPHQRLRQAGPEARGGGACSPPPSRKKQRGEFSPGAYRCLIVRPPSVEKL